jgi:sec-independent protein translocase protein TatA
MGMPGMSEWVIILLVIVILFGGKKIPELAKGIGKGIKDFKKAMNEDDEPAVEIKESDKKLADAKPKDTAQKTATESPKA